MNSYLLYLLEVSCVFAVFYSLFYLLFRRLTFHAGNRFLLLLILPISFAIPILDVGLHPVIVGEIELPKFDEFIVSTSRVVETINSFSQKSMNVGSYLFILYWVGFVVSVFKLVLHAYKLLNLKRRSQIHFKQGYYFITANVSSVFSCFNWIFVPNNQLDTYEKPIIEHEKVHARLWHTFDLIVTEIFVALLWFNPFVFFFRKSIKSIHEFQADEHVLRGGVQKSYYLELMLNNLEKSRLVDFYSYFNCYTIKNRVEMITTDKSRKNQIIKYLLFVPVIALLTMAFTGSPENPPSIFPIKKGEYDKITQPFGRKFINPITKKEKVHGGIDIKATEGVSVLATSDGTVVRVSSEKGWGNLVVIDHGNGYQTWYAHLKDFAVEKGQKVKIGQTVGSVGNTGYSTGPHLHYEVRLNKKRVNPMDYCEK